jgi:hypothetical protein
MSKPGAGGRYRDTKLRDVKKSALKLITLLRS